MKIRIVLLSFVALFLAGSWCPGSNGSESGTSSGTNPGTDPGADPFKTIEGQATVLCQALVKGNAYLVGPPKQLEMLESFNTRGLCSTGGLPTPEYQARQNFSSCKPGTDDFNRALAIIKSPSSQFSVDSLAACLDQAKKIRAQFSGAPQATQLVSQAAKLYTEGPCSQVVKPKLKKDQECKLASDCDRGSCLIDEKDPTRLVCYGEGAVYCGENSIPPGKKCAPGFVCENGSSYYSYRKVCMKPVADGQPCDDQKNSLAKTCQSSCSICKRDKSGKQTCQAGYGQKGEDCILSTDCSQGLRCPSSQYKCEDLLTAGTCYYNYDCAAGYYCKNSACAVRPKIGQICDASDKTLGNYVCSDGICVNGNCVGGAAGQPCSLALAETSTCESGLNREMSCINGQCGSPLTIDAKCGKDLGSCGQGQWCRIDPSTGMGTCQIQIQPGGDCDKDNFTLCASGKCFGGRCGAVEPPQQYSPEGIAKALVFSALGGP